MKIYDVIYCFQLGCMFIGFIFSLITIKNKNVPFYFGNFYLYSLVAMFCVIIASCDIYFNNEKLSEVSDIINILSIIFHFLFLSNFLYRIIELERFKKFLRLLILFFFFLVLAGVIFCAFYEKGVQAFAIANLGLVLFCTFYFYQVLIKERLVDLLVEPSFWVVIGIFFCMTITVPITAIETYSNYKLDPDFMVSINAIANVAYGAMHLFFVKAYLCAIKP